MDKTQLIAQKRLEEIAYAEERIKNKAKAFSADDPRQAGWAKRLAEYGVSKIALALALKSGTIVRIKDVAQMALVAAMVGGDVPKPTAGTVVDVPAGDLTLEGK